MSSHLVVMAGELTIEGLRRLYAQLLPHMAVDRERVRHILERWARAEAYQAPKRYYTPAELAELFGVSMYTIKRWRLQGKLPYQKMNSRTYRYPKYEIDRIVAQARAAKRPVH